MKNIFFLLSFLTVKCFGASLPPIPDRFSAIVNYNIKSAMFPGMLKGDSLGFTITAYENVNQPGNMSSITFNMESQALSDSSPVITKNTILWNPSLSGIKNFVTYAEVNGKLENCVADEQHSDLLQMLLWGFDGQNPVMPGAKSFLHYDRSGFKVGKQGGLVNGILTNAWYKNIAIDIEPKTRLIGNLTYYFSDAKNWDGTAGSNFAVPVYATLFGSLGGDDLEMHIVYTEFFDFNPDYSNFYLPAEAWCQGRGTGNDKLPLILDGFYYRSEYLKHISSIQDPTQVKNIIYPVTEWVDYAIEASKARFKPINPLNFDNPFDTYGGYIDQIRDFRTGIAYSVSLLYQNCSITYIDPLIDVGQDMAIGPNGNLKLNSPHNFFGMNQSFNINGAKIIRGELANVFIANNPKAYSGKGYTTVLYFSTRNEFIEGLSAKVERNTLLKFIGYPDGGYNDPLQRMEVNVFDFNTIGPNLNRFDITYCFAGNQMVHKMFRMGWSSEYDLESNRRTLEMSVRSSIASTAGVTPLRIQRIMFDEKKDESAMYVIFTIVDPPTLSSGETPNITYEPANIKTSLVIKNIQDSIKDGWVISYVDALTNKQFNSKVDKTFFADLDRTGDHGFSPNGSKNKSSKNSSGYSPGSMAVLGIFMILIGGAIGVGVFYFVLKW